VIVGRNVSRLDDAEDASDNSKSEKKAESDLGFERNLELVDESDREKRKEEIEVDGDGCG